MCYTIKRISPSDLKEVAHFIAQLNSEEQHNIGYCGQNEQELLNTLHEDFVDGDHTSILAAFNNGTIQALIGLDLDDDSSEVWGPFSIVENVTILKKLLHTIQFTIKAIAALAFVFGIIVYLISDNLIGLFTNDPQLIEMGSYILHVTFLSLFITGMTTLFTGIFQATAQGTAAFIMSIIQGITLIPVLFIANHTNGFHGVVWALVIADAVAFLVGAFMLYVLRNKLQPDLESLVH